MSDTAIHHPFACDCFCRFSVKELESQLREKESGILEMARKIDQLGERECQLMAELKEARELNGHIYRKINFCMDKLSVRFGSISVKRAEEVLKKMKEMSDLLSRTSGTTEGKQKEDRS